MRIERLVFILFFAAVNLYAHDVRRGRNEGTLNIPASNVPGSGNIAVYGLTRGGVGIDGMKTGLYMGGSIGVAEIMKLSAQGSLPQFSGIGPLRASMQVTLPGNDKLRFFGVAARADLYLSTIPDTVGGEARPGKPDYHSFIRPNLIVDLDWLSLFKWLPLKLYVKGSMVDDPELLHAYNQLSFNAGAEWKMYRHSFFVDMRYGFYKGVRRGSIAADRSYEQSLLFLEPGVRFRTRNNLRILAGLRILAHDVLKDDDGLRPSNITLTLGLEVPLLFRETNTEAIRTLMFKEQRKGSETEDDTEIVDLGESVRAELEEFDDEADLDIRREEQIQRRRVEIENTITEIEELLRELD